MSFLNLDTIFQSAKLKVLVIISNINSNNKGMVNATIKSKTGAVITIKGTQEEVSNIVSHFEHSVVMNEFKKMQSKKHAIKKEQKKRLTASDLIIELKEESFFDKPKTLLEISNKLEEKGYIYPVTTLSGVVIGLIKRKLLGRKKNEKKWVYGK